MLGVVEQPDVHAVLAQDLEQGVDGTGTGGDAALLYAAGAQAGGQQEANRSPPCPR